jgi:MOSC domain-containing protein
MDIASIQSIHRYPVKSMAGEVVERCDLTADGLSGDRLYAFESSGAPVGMLRLTGRERREMLAYQARSLLGGRVDVRVPTGEEFLVDSPALISYLTAHMPGANSFHLSKTSTPQTDVRPLSVISLQTIEELGKEMGEVLDPRRFRANLYLDLPAGPFMEDILVGRTLRIGSTAALFIQERDPRCRFITYDPAAPLATAPLFSLMQLLDRFHEGRAGVYAAVINAGPIQAGDAVRLADSTAYHAGSPEAAEDF